ncbi:MAG: toll/interleukin-1 receptor domain-containing protein, partial [Elusimicrobia bacterium]|nr:toll/interleukin-1 receptor domain-containing protein [Elusimicrobiota bacterium]
MPDFKYWAFISYSHRDKSWADWLHKSLETFVVPGRLIGRASRDEKVPARLYPIFRDREELPTSGDLGGNIEEALRQSRYLVVICSKASAASRWVDGEIRTFKAQGKADRVLCLIVDGEPNASDKAAGAAEECFAKSLRFKLGPGGALTEEPAEPIAADAREGMDGKENCLLKVAAGLLGVGFDELRQRDAERRRRARALALAGAAAIAGVLLWQERAKIVDLRRQLAQVDYERGKALRESGEGGASAVFFAESNRIRPTVAARANAAHFVRRTAIPQLI